MHVRKGDKVVITAGKDNGLDGEILAIDLKHGRVKVERRNMIVKHKRSNPLTGEEGARIDQEGWIDVSNVSLFSEKLQGPVRTQKRWVGKNQELFESYKAAAESLGGSADTIRKVRFAPKTGETFDALGGE